MSSTPPEAPTGPTGPSDSKEPGETGPRVTREEVRELGRIRRSTTDRKIAGVAAGVARHLDVDPLLVRIGFVLLAIFGGGGILAYAAGWLLIPEEGSDDATIRTDERTRTTLLTVVAAICALSLFGDAFGGWDFPWPLAIVGLVIAGIVAAKGPSKPHPGPLAHPSRLPKRGWVHPGPSVPPPGTPGASYVGYQPGPLPRPAHPLRRGPILFWFTMGLAALAAGILGTVDAAGADVPVAAYPATVMLTCGVMLLVGAFYGRAGGLIFIGLLAAAATAVTSAVHEIDPGRIVATPTSAAALEDSYEQGVGQIRIDLREIRDLENLDGRTVDLDLEVGQIEVIVPDDGLNVDVAADIEGAGEARIFDERRDGSLENSFESGAGDPELTINADLVFGEIKVITEEVAR
jgi:phage shock protein PspC (stress-responsive transcriptional regulator)